MARRKKQPPVPRRARGPRPPSDATTRTFRRGVALSAIAVTGLCLVLVAVYAQRRPAPDPTPLPQALPLAAAGVSDPEYARRAALRDAWVQALDALVDRTQDREAGDVLTFIRGAGVLAAPSGAGIRPLEQRPGLPALQVSIVPLVPRDQQEDPFWASKIGDELAAGFFQAPLHAIVLKPDAMSPAWRGIILAHEGYHAMAYTRAPFDWREKRRFYPHERDTRHFQHRLMLELGGPAYLRCLEREQLRLRGTTTPETIREMRGTIDGRNPVYDPELDVAFGPAASRAERESRSSAVWIHAFFILIETSGTPDPQANEAALMEHAAIVAGRAPPSK